MNYIEARDCHILMIWQRSDGQTRHY